MIRWAKLAFLLAVIGLVVVLAALDHFAPALHVRTLRNGLRAESVACRALLIEAHENQVWQRLDWTRTVSEHPELGLALARLTGQAPPSKDPSAPDTAPVAEVDELAPPVDDPSRSVVQIFRDELERVNTSVASSHDERAPDVVALILSDGSVAASVDPDGVLESETVHQAIASLGENQVDRRAVVDDYDSVYFVAYSPVESETGRVVGYVIAMDRLDASTLGRVVSGARVDVVFFRNDGHIYTSNLERDDLRRAAERFITDAIEANRFVEVSDPTSDAIFEESGGNLLALLGGHLPPPNGAASRTTVGFVILLDGGQMPSSLLAMVREHWRILPPSNRLWVMLGFGLVLLIFGVALFEIEGHRYRRAIGLLEYQLAQRDQSYGDSDDCDAMTEQDDRREDSPIVLTTETEAVSDDDTTTDLESLFEDYLAQREKNGESNDGTTFDGFRDQLQRSEQEVMTRFACNAVRFKVGKLHKKIVVMVVPQLQS